MDADNPTPTDMDEHSRLWTGEILYPEIDRIASGLGVEVLEDAEEQAQQVLAHIRNLTDEVVRLRSAVRYVELHDPGLFEEVSELTEPAVAESYNEPPEPMSGTVTQRPDLFGWGIEHPCSTCGGRELVPNGLPSNGPDACPDCGPALEIRPHLSAKLRELLVCGWPGETPDEMAEFKRTGYDHGHTTCLLAGLAADEIDRLAAEVERLTVERDRAVERENVWMNAVADVVEPFGFDRGAACGPSDLLPGLDMLVAERGRYVDALDQLLGWLRHDARPLGPDDEMNEAEQTEHAYASMLLARFDKQFGEALRAPVPADESEYYKFGPMDLTLERQAALDAVRAVPADPKETPDD